ncbi:hypothetical protein [Micromonospora sp. RTGN7]|uniref:hypothetical protein n=1 Tax=Micromonospora sp. RTGN7 TaxID=3016526 RepID=UPI0029FEF378|nr:hypothetical protein [Micromonospora sp. RTGN7]
MLIDCDGCGIRGAGCPGCLVTALLDDDAPTGALGVAEQRAIEVFARAGIGVEVLEVLEVTSAGRRSGRGDRVA